MEENKIKIARKVELVMTNGAAQTAVVRGQAKDLCCLSEK
jgi:hypothetical protein